MCSAARCIGVVWRATCCVMRYTWALLAACCPRSDQNAVQSYRETLGLEFPARGVACGLLSSVSDNSSRAWVRRTTTHCAAIITGAPLRRSKVSLARESTLGARFRPTELKATEFR